MRSEKSSAACRERQHVQVVARSWRRPRRAGGGTRHQRAVVRRLAVVAVGLETLADMLDRGGRLLVIVGRAAEHVGQKPRAQEGVRHDLLDDRHRACAAHREQRPVPGEIRRRHVLGQQMLDADLPVAGDLGRERAAVGRQRPAEVGRPRRARRGEEDDARRCCVGERRQVKLGRSGSVRRDRRRRAQELALQVVGPAVEAAAEGLAVARGRARPPACSGAGRRCAGPAPRLPCRARRSTPQPPTVADRKSPGLAIWPSAQSGSHSVAKSVRFSAWKASPWV